MSERTQPVRVSMKRSVPYLLPLLLLLSCGDNSTDPEGDDGKIMPLAVGNRWIGRVTERNPGGAGMDSYLDTIELLSKRAQPQATSGVAFVDNRGWEWYYVGDELHIGACDFDLLPISIECGPLALSPATKGRIFGERFLDSIPISDPSGNPVSVALVMGVQVESVDTTVSVEAGEFHALVYREFIVSPGSIHYPTTNHSFYSPGVGVVLYEQKHESGDIDFRWELAAYRMGEE